MTSESGPRGALEEVFRAESHRVLATLVRLLGDFALAEEARSEALLAALEAWPRTGVPARPRAWLVSAGRFKAIDRIRRRARLDRTLEELAARLADQAAGPEAEPAEVEDDLLRLIFTCCDPDLPLVSQMALTLREVCGLTTEEIARAFLDRPATVSQRIVRAKARLREKGIPVPVPGRADLPTRLPPVLRVLYLVYNEGYKASSGAVLVRHELSGQAISLGRELARLLPEAEVLGLLALMLIQEARRPTRTTPEGDLVLLEDQDRTRWDRAGIAEGVALVEKALALPDRGTYALQAAIAAVHAEAAAFEDTDWPQVVALYRLLMKAEPTPVVALNAAVAQSMVEGPGVGVERIRALLRDQRLADYQPAHTALADLLRRAGHRAEAAVAYRRALELAELEPERRFLRSRIEELGGEVTNPTRQP